MLSAKNQGKLFQDFSRSQYIESISQGLPEPGLILSLTRLIFIKVNSIYMICMNYIRIFGFYISQRHLGQWWST